MPPVFCLLLTISLNKLDYSVFIVFCQFVLVAQIMISVLCVLWRTPLYSCVFVSTISVSPPHLSFIHCLMSFSWSRVILWSYFLRINNIFSLRFNRWPSLSSLMTFRSCFTRLSISETSPANSHDLFYFCNSCISCLHSVIVRISAILFRSATTSPSVTSKSEGTYLILCTSLHSSTCLVAIFERLMSGYTSLSLYL